MNTKFDTADRELISARVIPAPQELVWQAWTDPKQLAQWWGPKGFRNTFQEFDLKPGGLWRFVMHDPHGADHPNLSVFVEIVKPERIVFDHVSSPRFQVTVTFSGPPGETKIMFRMLFDSAPVRDKAAIFAVEGNEQNFDRLEAHLVRMALDSAAK